MTWSELANFINSAMPECNKNEVATVWDNETGGWYPIISISAFDEDEAPDEMNFYSVDIDTSQEW